MQPRMTSPAIVLPSAMEAAMALDIVAPLQYVGAEALRKVWQEVFETFQGPIPYEARDLRITAGEDVSFSHSLNRNNGTMKNGQKVDLWLRWTACYRKSHGRSYFQ
jgi:ketosteroid isomerase-like protein